MTMPRRPPTRKRRSTTTSDDPGRRSAAQPARGCLRLDGAGRQAGAELERREHRETRECLDVPVQARVVAVERPRLQPRVPGHGAERPACRPLRSSRARRPARPVRSGHRRRGRAGLRVADRERRSPRARTRGCRRAPRPSCRQRRRLRARRTRGSPCGSAGAGPRSAAARTRWPSAVNGCGRSMPQRRARH